ncbi:triose-phosphate isomerase [Hyphobacterium sp.]|uniref:triose-phosphate isomerase n=1 Tax=Hyphobacterium sp. TaxID=2004662 RepID=UPI003748D7C5
MARRMLIAGNWKMNGLRQSLGFLEEIRPAAHSRRNVDVLLAPPATLIVSAAEIAGPVKIGGQDCHIHPSGAHTGDISAEMLRDAGASYVIVGHSERRADHGESSELVRAKAEAAQAAGLVPMICVGESESDRREGKAEAVVGEQLHQSLPGSTAYVIAYEPVWAIGTGLTASLDDIAAMHAFIRSKLPDGATTQILYGGSVKPANAADILSLNDVDGALVGGASLKAADFGAIIEAAP